ncbi:hypothetical protein ADUPG1_007021 [Aduncisulcus paluster]|uniref:Uncharacterized protein n=1 Tax=Aduncisulcus paluster TaxID=2918883 RepID=A0ABQ5KKE0_9EUKA|nr:hypothetical protein ADUPG1_007021 [Aduncisulcus paluster]
MTKIIDDKHQLATLLPSQIIKFIPIRSKQGTDLIFHRSSSVQLNYFLSRKKPLIQYQENPLFFSTSLSLLVWGFCASLSHKFRDSGYIFLSSSLIRTISVLKSPQSFVRVVLSLISVTCELSKDAIFQVFSLKEASSFHSIAHQGKYYDIYIQSIDESKKYFFLEYLRCFTNNERKGRFLFILQCYLSLLRILDVCCSSKSSPDSKWMKVVEDICSNLINCPICLTIRALVLRELKKCSPKSSSTGKSVPQISIPSKEIRDVLFRIEEFLKMSSLAHILNSIVSLDPSKLSLISSSSLHGGSKSNIHLPSHLQQTILFEQVLKSTETGYSLVKPVCDTMRIHIDSIKDIHANLCDLAEEHSACIEASKVRELKRIQLLEEEEERRQLILRAEEDALFEKMMAENDNDDEFSEGLFLHMGLGEQEDTDEDAGKDAGKDASNSVSGEQTDEKLKEVAEKEEDKIDEIEEDSVDHAEPGKELGSERVASSSNNSITPPLSLSAHLYSFISLPHSDSQSHSDSKFGLLDMLFDECESIAGLLPDLSQQIGSLEVFYDKLRQLYVKRERQERIRQYNERRQRLISTGVKRQIAIKNSEKDDDILQALVQEERSTLTRDSSGKGQSKERTPSRSSSEKSVSFSLLKIDTPTKKEKSFKRRVLVDVDSFQKAYDETRMVKKILSNPSYLEKSKKLALHNSKIEPKLSHSGDHEGQQKQSDPLSSNDPSKIMMESFGSISDHKHCVVFPNCFEAKDLLDRIPSFLTKAKKIIIEAVKCCEFATICVELQNNESEK